MTTFTSQAFKEEADRILSWWSTEMLDDEYGGFIGKIDAQGIKTMHAEKGVVMNTRLLWVFSAAIRQGFPEYKKFADRAYQYIVNHFLDHNYGGLYWMLDYKGNPVVKRKQTYAQAFGIFSLVEYFMATGNKVALRNAQEIFELVELHAHDQTKNGYIEAFTQQWNELEDVRMKEGNTNNIKTMNTHLQLLNAFTNLHRCDKRAAPKTALYQLSRIIRKKFIDKNTGRLKLFFDKKWNENFQFESFGHEIEAAWLLNNAVQILDVDTEILKAHGIASKIARKVESEGMAPLGGIYNERKKDGEFHPLQEWWSQAEAVTGFYDAYEKTGHEKYKTASENSWKFINDYFIDKEHGDWYWSVNANSGKPNLSDDKANAWKANYHNVRMCFEMMKRLDK